MLQHLRKYRKVIFFVLLSFTGFLVYMHNKGHTSKEPRNALNGFNQSLLPPGECRNWTSVCHIPQCTRSMLKAVSGSSKRIPPIRHILWKSERVSVYFARHLKSWSDIHPDWKYILWRDSDVDRFVAKYFPHVTSKFRSLPQHIMRLDMVRYMILFHLGGVYADLDYTLVRPLDEFQRLPAVVTREPEPLSLLHFGMGAWPPPVFGSPAFMMSEPRHPFFNFCISQILARPVRGIFEFAGPIALTELLRDFAKRLPATTDCSGEIVFVPPSRNFYPYDDNNFRSSTSSYTQVQIDGLKRMCSSLSPQAPSNLINYCRDVNDLNPIVDPSDPVYASHDNNKSRSSYDPSGSPEFEDKNQVNIRSVLKNLVMAGSLF